MKPKHIMRPAGSEPAVKLSGVRRGSKPPLGVAPSLSNLIRAYRLALVAFRHSPEHAELTADDPVALRTIVPARDALLDIAEIRCDAEATDALLLAEELAGRPDSLANDSVAPHLISLVAAYLAGGHRHSAPTPATAEADGFLGQVGVARSRLAAVSECELEVIFNGAARSKAAAFDALDIQEESTGAMLALEQVSFVCDVWCEAAALELRARLIRGEVLSDNLAARVLLRACLSEAIYPLGASVLAAAAAEALGELQAA